MNYSDINAQTIDRWVENGWEWGKPISHQEFTDALSGKWKILLTPTKGVPKEWFPDLKGKTVLGLASGGAQQMPILCALGAKCTVMDYSVRQLESERFISEREGYSIDIIRSDMTKPFPFPENTFDIIIHPVSNCYVQDVLHIWKECARVIKPGGLLMSGLDNGFNYLFEEDNETHITGTLPFDPLSNPEQMRLSQNEDAGIQFSHSIEEQITGQIKAGFELLDIYDDTNGSGFLHEHRVPTFWATLAKKKM